MIKNICIVCGREKEENEFTCERCAWCDFDDGILTPDEIGGANGNISLNVAKANWKKGLNKRGEPLMNKNK